MKASSLSRTAILAVAFCLFSNGVFAADQPKIDAADTGFMIASTGLVLMMTLPGLALFYAGMVRKTNMLAMMAQSAAATVIVSILWVAAGYSLAFSGGDAWIGTLGAHVHAWGDHRHDQPVRQDDP